MPNSTVDRFLLARAERDLETATQLQAAQHPLMTPEAVQAAQHQVETLKAQLAEREG
jgi:hypothetical protein